jgi:hypothetical protein
LAHAGTANAKARLLSRAFCIAENFSGANNYFFLAAALDLADFAADLAAGLAAGLARSITVVVGCALA